MRRTAEIWRAMATASVSSSALAALAALYACSTWLDLGPANPDARAEMTPVNFGPGALPALVKGPALSPPFAILVSVPSGTTATQFSVMWLREMLSGPTRPRIAVDFFVSAAAQMSSSTRPRRLRGRSASSR